MDGGALFCMLMLMEEKMKNKKRVTDRQKQILIDFMEANPKLNQGIFTKTFKAEDSAKLWAQLVELLNLEENGARKEVDKWKACWRDIKSYVREKAAKIQKRKNGEIEDGNNYYYASMFLTALEEKIVEIIGHAAVYGIEGAPPESEVEAFSNDQPASILPATESAPPEFLFINGLGEIKVEQQDEILPSTSSASTPEPISPVSTPVPVSPVATPVTVLSLPAAVPVLPVVAPVPVAAPVYLPSASMQPSLPAGPVPKRSYRREEQEQLESFRVGLSQKLADICSKQADALKQLAEAQGRQTAAELERIALERRRLEIETERVDIARRSLEVEESRVALKRLKLETDKLLQQSLVRLVDKIMDKL